MTNRFFSIDNNHKYLTISFLGIKINYKKREKAVAFIDCGGIGDYILLRKYLKYVKESNKFKGLKFVYFSKNVYKNILETYEKGIFEDIVIYPEMTSAELNKCLKKYDFEYMINLFAIFEENDYLTFWRKRRSLIKKINAKHTIADVVTDKDDIKHENLKKYNTIITTSGYLFELERRRRFFEKLIDEPIPIEDVKMEPICNFKKDYIIISPYTNDTKRDYPNEKWANVINHILKNTDSSLQILFIGIDKDRKKAKKIFDLVDDEHNRCKNIIGMNDISLLPSIISGAKFILGGDTGTIHIAKAVGCPAICLSIGNSYGRFLPYPDGVDYVYPDEFKKLIDNNNTEELRTFYNRKLIYSMNDIKEEDVISAINKYLN